MSTVLTIVKKQKREYEKEWEWDRKHNPGNSELVHYYLGKTFLIFVLMSQHMGLDEVRVSIKLVNFLKSLTTWVFHKELETNKPYFFHERPE